MNSAPTSSEKAPKTNERELRNKAQAGRARRSPRKRTIPTIAVFSSAPDSMAETGAGPSLCASGSHVCIGARPTFVP